MPVYMNDAHYHNQGYYISTDNSLLRFTEIFNYLDTESYWAKGIPEDKLRKAITNSLCFGVYKNNEQAGFARVITDKATFAYLCDVFILSAHRKSGLSKWLMQTIISHPDLQGLRRFVLATADAHGLYKQFGFELIKGADRWMEIFTPYK